MSCIQSLSYREGRVQSAGHVHNAYQLLVVCGGEADILIQGYEHHVTAPSIVWMSNLEPHAVTRCTDDYARYVLRILPEMAFRQLEDAPRLLSPFTDRPTGFSHVLPLNGEITWVVTMCELLSREIQEHTDSIGELALLQSLLCCLFHRFPDAFPCNRQVSMPVVQRIKQRFSSNPKEEISLLQLSQEYHISESHLSHSFKKETGYSIGRYQHLCRLALAKELLTTTAQSITEICADCGFSDASNFSRYFRREFGCSPSQFRSKRAE